MHHLWRSRCSTSTSWCTGIWSGSKRMTYENFDTQFHRPRMCPILDPEQQGWAATGILHADCTLLKRANAAPNFKHQKILGELPGFIVAVEYSYVLLNVDLSTRNKMYEYEMVSTNAQSILDQGWYVCTRCTSLCLYFVYILGLQIWRSLGTTATVESKNSRGYAWGA